MKFHNLFISSVSACFELETTTAYYSPAAYDVLLNGVPAILGGHTNVFSLFDLEPGKEYLVSIGETQLRFTTKAESGCIRVRDFGAAGDGKTDDTAAIQNAIHFCPAGGRVLVEAGTYCIRPLVLKSHITLELKPGAVLLGDTCEDHYPLLPGEIMDGKGRGLHQVATWEGNPYTCHQSLISAFHGKDITIVGRGVIDGNAQNSTWWEHVKQRTIGRPRLVFLNQCTNVTFHGILGRNSASWNFHPFFSKEIAFYDAAVEAPKDSPNTDGTDPES